MSKHKNRHLTNMRKVRSDKGTHTLQRRDITSQRWMVEQHGLTHDQLHTLLCREPGANARFADRISMSAMRMVMARWLAAGWIEKEKTTINGPTWIWPTNLCISRLRLPFRAHAPAEATRSHLSSVNAVRLALEETMPEGRWVSERYLRLGLTHEKGQQLPHVPDAEWRFPDGTCIGIEVELTVKRQQELRSILISLVKGRADPDAEVDIERMTLEEKSQWLYEMMRKRGEAIRRQMQHSRYGYAAPPKETPELTAIRTYDEVWYFASATVRPALLRMRKHLETIGVLQPHEASAILVFSYPLIPGEQPS
jgi:hypothetical protein